MGEKQKQFGTRYLTDESEVFRYNAWDNVEWNPEQEAEALRKIAEQRKAVVSLEEAEILVSNPVEQWEIFYRTHGNRFFMDRNWLLNEFPELDVANKVREIIKLFSIFLVSGLVIKLSCVTRSLSGSRILLYIF